MEIINRIEEIIKLEKSLLKLFNKIIVLEDKKSSDLTEIQKYYDLALIMESKAINQLEINGTEFIEIINYLNQKCHLNSNCNHIENIIFENPNLPILRFIYKITNSLLKDNIIKIENCEQEKMILKSIYNYKAENLTNLKELYSLILIEEQLARIYLYNLEKENLNIKAKDKLSYVYNKQLYEQKMTIIESNQYLKFYKTDIFTHHKVEKKFLVPCAIGLLSLGNREEQLGTLIEEDILLKSIIYLLDDKLVGNVIKMAKLINSNYSLNIINTALEEKYDNHFKRK